LITKKITGEWIGSSNILYFNYLIYKHYHPGDEEADSTCDALGLNTVSMVATVKAVYLSAFSGSLFVLFLCFRHPRHGRVCDSFLSF